MNIHSFREKVNLFIYSSKERNLRILRYISFFVSLSAISALIIYHGFTLNIDKRSQILMLIHASFVFYILNFLTKILYTFEPKKFLKDNLLEGILVILLIIDGLSSLFFKNTFSQGLFNILGLSNIGHIYILFLQIYLLVIVGIDMNVAIQKLQKIKIDPSTMFVLSFVILIFAGSGLLMLPEMTTGKFSMPFLEALFTSISASCVTGLIVVDTATYFSFKGQFVIMLLIQLGGLSIISFAAFLNFASSVGVGIKQQSLIQNFLSTESLSSAKSMLKQIIFITFIIEFFGSLCIFFLWNPKLEFVNYSQKLFYSVFHSVSAFNNAGFALFTNGLFETNVKDSYVLHLIIAFLIILGGLGFGAIKDLFGISNLRQRLNTPWKTIKLNTQVALYSTIFLLIIGTIAFYFLEKNNTLKGQKFVETIITSFFQSTTARTAGFNTVDFAIIGQPMLLFFIFLMFVGASPGSTGGGIKTSTFTLLILSATSTITGKRNLELRKHFISNEMLNKAFTIFLFASGFVFIGTFILSITDPQFTIINLAFEEVSAFATVGLSTGITAKLSVAGKIVLMFSMFVGRVGILTLAFSLSKKVISRNYKYPSAHIIVG